MQTVPERLQCCGSKMCGAVLTVCLTDSKTNKEGQGKLTFPQPRTMAFSNLFARAHAVGPVLGPHNHTNRARDTQVAEPRPPAPKYGQPGEGQRLKRDAPQNGGKPPPPGTAPYHPRGTQPPTGHADRGDSAGPPHPHIRAHSTWVADPDSSPRGRTAGGGRVPALRLPSQRQKAPPSGTPFRQPHSAQRRLARAQAVGPVLGPHANDNPSQETWAAEPWLPAPRDGQATPPGTHTTGTALRGPQARTNRAREPRTGPRNSGLPPRGRDGWRRDSA